MQARFVIPANYIELLASAAGTMARAEPEKPEPPGLSGTALIVEDNLIIAMSAEVFLLELGARHVDTASSVTEAMKAIDRAAPDFALLDLNLGSENSIPVGTRLSQMTVPFVFATGYGERAPIPEELGHVPVIQKPYTRETIEAALARLKLAGKVAS